MNYIRTLFLASLAAIFAAFPFAIPLLAAPPPTTSTGSTPTAAEVALKLAVPWADPDCLAAYDWRDTIRIGTKVSQWNDKTGRGRHLTHTTDATRQTWTTTGAWGRGGIYDVSNGGITGVSSQNFTAIWIGRDFAAEDPNTGATSTNGSLYLPPSGPRMTWDSCYGMRAAAGIYGPAPVFTPAAGPTIYAQAFNSTEALYFTAGLTTSKAALSLSTGNTITKVFGQHDGFGALYRVTQAVLFFGRKLTTPEIVAIGNYYGCPTTPPATIVYCFGSSTPQGQGAGSFQNGCVQLFADAIGASRGTWSVGGAGWNESANALATAGAFNVHRGTRGLHFILPASNNLAAHVAVATCETAITDQIARIRAADPLAWIMLFPVAPRNASFSGGQTYDDFDNDRLALNTFMETTASASAGVVYLDYMTVDKMGDKGDEADTTYFDPDKLHYNAAGHREVSKSAQRGWIELHQGASVEDPEPDNVLPFHRADPRSVIFGDSGRERRAA